MKLKNAISILTCLTVAASMSLTAVAAPPDAPAEEGAPSEMAMEEMAGEGESAEGESEGGESAGGSGGAALPSGGAFGDVTTEVINNTVVLSQAGELTINEEAADIYQTAEGAEISPELITGLYIRNASVHNINNTNGTTEQGISGVVFVDTDATFGGSTGYYAVDEGDDAYTAPAVTATEDGSGYSNVIILDDEDDEFSRPAAELANGAALSMGGGTEDTLFVVDNSYLWTAGFKRTSLFADDNALLMVVRNSRLVSPGAENYKKGWQALYGGARDTLLMGGDCWFYNDEIVTEGWGGLAIDSSPNLDLYAVNTTVDVTGGGYVSYTPGDGSINFYGVAGNSALYGVFVTGNSSAYLHSMDDMDETAATYYTEEDAAADLVTDDGRTQIYADYAAYLTHQGGANSTTTEAYLFAENTLLSTETDLRIADNSHFLNDGYSGASWFWSEFLRGSTMLCRSTNATFELENVELESRTGVIFQTIVNWEGPDKDFTLADDEEAVGNTLLMTDMNVTGDIRNDDVYRNLYVTLTDTTVDGAMISSTVADWNERFSAAALESSDAYLAALEEMASWEEEIPNATYDAEVPYADFVLDVEAASEYLTLPETDAVRGIYLTLSGSSTWYVADDSQLMSLTIEDGASVQVPVGVEYTITVDGTPVDELTAGTYSNVVISFGEAIAAPAAEAN